MERKNREHQRTDLKWLFRTVLRPFTAPQLDVREDYPKMRKLQNQVADLSGARRNRDDRFFASMTAEHQIPVRMFHPKQRTRDLVLLFFHGGGWVTGNIDSYATACARMAELTGAVVASVDYRLAPEHPFPSGLEDCLSVTVAAMRNPQLVDGTGPEQIILVGDSAGGNLAAAVSLILRAEADQGARGQILLYPVTQADHDPDTSPFESVREHGSDYRLTNEEVDAYFDLYAPVEGQSQHPLISMLDAKDLSQQPCTLLLSAELDLLRDEGEAYGEALRAAGNTVEVHRVPGALHGFITLPRFTRPVKDAYEVINAYLDRAEKPLPPADYPAHQRDGAPASSAPASTPGDAAEQRS